MLATQRQNHIHEILTKQGAVTDPELPEQLQQLYTQNGFTSITGEK